MATSSQSLPKTNQLKLVFQYPNSASKINSCKEVQARKNREENNFIQFIKDWGLSSIPSVKANSNAAQEMISALTYWCQNSSACCPNCEIIQFGNLLPSFYLVLTRPRTRVSCKCKHDCCHPMLCYPNTTRRFGFESNRHKDFKAI